MSTSYSSGGGSARDTSNPSLGELMGNLSEDTSRLFRQEVALAKAEVRQEVSAAGSAVSELAAAAGLAQVGLIMASIAVAVALNRVMDLDWAFAIVAVVWFIVAAVLGVTGRNKLREVNPTPTRTAQTIREIPEAMKGR